MRCFVSLLSLLPLVCHGEAPSPTDASTTKLHEGNAAGRTTGGEGLPFGISAADLRPAPSALQEILPQESEADAQNPEGMFQLSEALRTQWWDPNFSRAPLYVRPIWGLSNRLRTLVGAYAAARAVSRNVVVIWHPAPQCPARLSELFRGVASANQPPQGAKVLEHHGRCEYEVETLAALEQVPDKQPILVEACGFQVKSLVPAQHRAFHALHLAPAIRKEVSAILEGIIIPGRSAIGVHIRQGSLQDAREGHFFGKFKRPPASMREIPCCTDDAPHWTCPGHAHPLEDYIKSMHQKPAQAPIFYVASDRPACLRQLLEDPSAMEIVYSRIGSMDKSGHNNVPAALVDLYALAACHDLISLDPGSWTGLVHTLHRGFVEALGSAVAAGVNSHEL